MVIKNSWKVLLRVCRLSDEVESTGISVSVCSTAPQSRSLPSGMSCATIALWYVLLPPTRKTPSLSHHTHLSRRTGRVSIPQTIMHSGVGNREFVCSGSVSLSRAMAHITSGSIWEFAGQTRVDSKHCKRGVGNTVWDVETKGRLRGEVRRGWMEENLVLTLLLELELKVASVRVSPRCW